MAKHFLPVAYLWRGCCQFTKQSAVTELFSTFPCTNINVSNNTKKSWEDISNSHINQLSTKGVSEWVSRKGNDQTQASGIKKWCNLSRKHWKSLAQENMHISSHSTLLNQNLLSPSGDLRIGLVWDNHSHGTAFWSDCWNPLQTELNYLWWSSVVLRMISDDFQTRFRLGSD